MSKPGKGQKSTHKKGQKSSVASVKKANLTKVVLHASALKDKIRSLAKIMAPLLVRRDALRLEKKDFDLKYSLVDLKGNAQSNADLSLALNDAEIKAMRALARSTFGFRPVHIDMFSTFYFNSSGAGLVAGNIPVEPSTLTEFIAMASLFDEYKVHGGEYRFQLLAATQNTGSSINSYGTVGYDPTDSTAPPSLITMSQLQQHKLCFKTIFATTIGLTLLRNDDHRFVFSVPPGVVTETGNPATAGTSNWQPTVGPTPQPYGFIKAYFDNMLPVSSSCVSGQLTYFIEFRCRE